MPRLRTPMVVLASIATVAAVSPSTAAGRGGPPRDLPDDGPAALYRAAPTLPHARGWPADDDAFPATSGSGRTTDGAFYWTDYLYDDHGASTAPSGGSAVTAGAPSFGTYAYPDGPRYASNAADILRTGVALRRHATYWRVDWTTLADPAVPMAVWTFDRDRSTATGASTWPAAAGVASPGIDTALTVTSTGARLVDLDTGATLRRLRTQVTPAAHSFVVRVPRKALPVRGRWTVRLAAGLAGGDGQDELAQPPSTSPAQPRVYNVGFRSWRQEPPANNFWNDFGQTQALDTGDVSAFGATVSWRRLAHRRTTRPRVHPGWNDRVYVSSVDLDDGVLVDPATIEDGEANFLGRVQPYAVYVPAHHRRDRLPVTWLLHSSTQNHNQYAATTPRFTSGACERRRSLCVTTLGRGPDGNYFGTAELDFWEVWHDVSTAFRLDPERTVLSGYSLGGEGANQLAMAHPDLFARNVTLAGGIGDTPSLVNLRWVPTYLAGGAADELVPLAVQRDEAEALKRYGYRFRWVVVTGVDHVAYELCDCFDDAVAYMRGAKRVARPARFTFRWHPENGHLDNGFGPNESFVYWTQRPDLGVGTTGAYWVRSLAARSTALDAQVEAKSTLLPGRAVTPHASTGIDPTVQPAPSEVTEQTWSLGGPTARGREVQLVLTNVRSLRLLPQMAGLRPGGRATLRVTTDGPTTLRVGSRVLHLDAGRHVVRLD